MEFPGFRGCANSPPPRSAHYLRRRGTPGACRELAPPNAFCQGRDHGSGPGRLNFRTRIGGTRNATWVVNAGPGFDFPTSLGREHRFEKTPGRQGIVRTFSGRHPGLEGLTASQVAAGGHGGSARRLRASFKNPVASSAVFHCGWSHRPASCRKESCALSDSPRASWAIARNARSDGIGPVLLFLRAWWERMRVATASR
jgi:hypothetical protein